MTDFLSAFRLYLLGQQAVTDLLNSDVTKGPTMNVYVLAMPAEEIEVGAHKVVVLLASGGEMNGRRTISMPKIDMVCYGETDFEAAVLERAVSESVKCLQRQTYGGVLLHNATLSSGPMQARDPETFWPAMRRQAILRCDEREVS
jgi:hypothetical protein